MLTAFFVLLYCGLMLVMINNTFMKTNLFSASVLASATLLFPVNSFAQSNEQGLGFGESLKKIVIDCTKHQAPDAFKTDGKIDNEKLIVYAVKNKPFPNQPVDSLNWLMSLLKDYGYKGSISSLAKEEQLTVMRISSLLKNNYVISAQMSYGIYKSQNILSKEISDVLGHFVSAATETSDQTPETNNTNTLIDQSMTLLKDVSPSVRGYARWAVRGYAYDDMVAVSAAMAGACMSGATKKEMSAIGKAIQHSQFDPDRDYTKEPPVKK